MQTLIRKWGSSFAVRIPKKLLDQCNLQLGSRVRITCERGRIVIADVRRKRYTLAQLVKGITKKNRHEEIYWGPPVGKEVW